MRGVSEIRTWLTLTLLVCALPAWPAAGATDAAAPAFFTPVAQSALVTLEAAELGGQAQPAHLRNDQQLAVSVVEEARLHGAVRHVPVDATPGVRIR